MTVFNWCENPAGTWQLVFEVGNDDNSFKKRDLEDEYIHYLVGFSLEGFPSCGHCPSPKFSEKSPLVPTSEISN